jgi:hypothetical protein
MELCHCRSNRGRLLHGIFFVWKELAAACSWSCDSVALRERQLIDRESVF